MSTAYSVYAHPKGRQWGFVPPQADGATQVAAISETGVTTVDTVSAVRLAALIQDKVRQGYQKVVQPKYLSTRVEGGALVGEFISSHPDLVTDALQGTQLFFVALPRTVDVIETVENFATTLDGSPGDALARDNWLKHSMRVTTYLPVLSSDATACLLVAHWARDAGHSVVAVQGKPMPTGSPKDERHAWRAYLRNWCDDQVVIDAFEFLEWPLSGFLQSPVPTHQQQHAAEADEWFFASQRLTF